MTFVFSKSKVLRYILSWYSI